MAQPEQQAQEEIDKLPTSAGWRVADIADANIHAARGVALREFPLESGFGFADYLLYVDGKAAGVIEAKKAGTTLIGVESQSSRYGSGLPASLPGAGRCPSSTNPRASRPTSPTTNLRRALGLQQAVLSTAFKTSEGS